MIVFRCLLLLALTSSVQALTVEESQLLAKESQQYKAWVLSRDYFFVTAIKPNRIKALAWQHIYVEMLPVSYPEKEKVLALYKQNLSDSELAKALKLAQSLHADHQLLDGFNEAELSSLNALHLKIPDNDKKTGVVGRVLPWYGAEKSNILLRFIGAERIESRDPWYRQIVPLTVTHEGQFYATNLIPGRYKLFITTAGISTSKQFRINKSEIRGLSLIDLRKISGTRKK